MNQSYAKRSKKKTKNKNKKEPDLFQNYIF